MALLEAISDCIDELVGQDSDPIDEQPMIFGARRSINLFANIPQIWIAVRCTDMH